MTEKPGEKALMAMKQMSNTVVEFKVPRVPSSRKGQMKILTEEQYIEVSVPFHLPLHLNFVRFNVIMNLI